MEQETGAEDLPATSDAGRADAASPQRKPSTQRKSAPRPKPVSAVSDPRPVPDFGDSEKGEEDIGDGAVPTSPAPTRKPAPRKPAGRKPVARKSAASSESVGGSSHGTGGKSTGTAKSANATNVSGAAKSTRSTPYRATAPKPASQAAAIVAAAQTLADRQRVTAEILDAEESSSPESTESAGTKPPEKPSSVPRTAPKAAARPVVTEPGFAKAEPDIAEADAEAGIAESDAEADVAEPSIPKPAPSSATVEPQQRAAGAAPSDLPRDTVLVVEGLSKSFAGTLAVDRVDLAVRAGSIFGIVGPNGAGKTTTLSMVTGLLRPDSGRVLVHGADVWKDPEKAKRNMGVLPDRLRLFDRLTGGQLLFYSGSLRGLDRATVKSRSRDLAVAFGLEDALGRLVTDYSAGMTKKIALAAAMIHSPRVLILDEPFEAVDPVSAANVIEILQKYAAAGGTVVMSSHSMDLIQRICDSVTIIVRGEVLASGTMEQVRNGSTLEDRFVELAGGRKAAEGMEWLHSFSG